MITPPKADGVADFLVRLAEARNRLVQAFGDLEQEVRGFLKKLTVLNFLKNFEFQSFELFCEKLFVQRFQISKKIPNPTGARHGHPRTREERLPQNRVVLSGALRWVLGGTIFLVLVGFRDPNKSKSTHWFPNPI